MVVSRRRWFDLHSWLGLQLSLLMSFVLITGTLATISPEIDWLFNPSARNYSLKPVASLDWQQVYDNARNAADDAAIIWLVKPAAPWFSVLATVQHRDGTYSRIFLNPETNAVQGFGRWYNWQRFFRQAHRHLMLPVAVGVTIVGLLSIPLLLSLLSSFYIYKRWWKGFSSLPKLTPLSNSRKHKRIYWRDMHRWVGVWSLWFIFLIGTTGLWYLAEQWGLKATFSAIPEQTDLSARTVPKDAVNRAIQAAQLSYPELEIRQIGFPKGKPCQIRLQGQASAWLVRVRANQLSYDSCINKVLDLRRGDNLRFHSRISEAADPLHFGTFGGPATRYIWFVFGAGLSLLSVSGVYLFGLRIWKAPRASHLSMPTFGRVLQLVWGKIGYTKWPMVLLLIMCFAVAGYLFS